jgi:hypothetical protein
MKLRAELTPGEAKVERFLSDLAVNGRVAAATQNQAFNALLFLYREVLHQPWGVGPQVSERGPGMGLAIRVSGSGLVEGPTLRRDSSAPPGRGHD